LPNFLCEQTEQRFRSDSKQRKWKHDGLVAAEVGYSRDRGETYSHLTVNGRQVPIPPSISKHSDLLQYLFSLGYGGWWQLGEFGGDLIFVFRPSSHATFKRRSEDTLASGTLLVFDFRVNSVNSSYTLHSEGATIHPGIEGSLWIDKSTSQLARIELHATEIAKNSPVRSFERNTTYDLVSIVDAGQFLLPVASETVACEQRSNCFRDRVTFDACRKFRVDSHVIADQ